MSAQAMRAKRCSCIECIRARAMQRIRSELVAATRALLRASPKAGSTKGAGGVWEWGT